MLLQDASRYMTSLTKKLLLLRFPPIFLDSFFFAQIENPSGCLPAKPGYRTNRILAFIFLPYRYAYEHLAFLTMTGSLTKLVRLRACRVWAYDRYA